MGKYEKSQVATSARESEVVVGRCIHGLAMRLSRVVREGAELFRAVYQCDCCNELFPEYMQRVSLAA
jgi:hypothetical protein